MGKNKKRLQMQKTDTAEEKFVREALADAVQMGLLDQIGYDEKGEPLYRMPDDAKERLARFKKTFGIGDADFSQ